MPPTPHYRRGSIDALAIACAGVVIVGMIAATLGNVLGWPS